MRQLLCAVVCAVFVSSVSGQIIFEPVRYQFGGQNAYYYGGEDPRVHALARHPEGVTWGRINGFDFVSGNMLTHREVAQGRARVFTDSLPYTDAGRYGMTPADAQNEANFSLPTYFRKSDLIDSAIPLPDGSAVVPARAPASGLVLPRGSIVIKPMPLIPRTR